MTLSLNWLDFCSRTIIRSKATFSHSHGKNVLPVITCITIFDVNILCNDMKCVRDTKKQKDEICKKVNFSTALYVCTKFSSVRVTFNDDLSLIRGYFKCYCAKRKCIKTEKFCKSMMMTGRSAILGFQKQFCWNSSHSVHIPIHLLTKPGSLVTRGFQR